MNATLASGNIIFKWDIIRTDIDKFNEILGTNFTSLSTNEDITENVMKIISDDLMNSTHKIDIEVLQRFIEFSK